MKIFEEEHRRTRSKSSASSRIRSLSKDERSLVCFQRGNDDLNSGSDTTPGQVSSEGVPSVLNQSGRQKTNPSTFLPKDTKELINFRITLKQRSLRVHLCKDTANRPNIHLKRRRHQIDHQREMSERRYLDMSNAMHRVELQVLDTIMSPPRQAYHSSARRRSLWVSLTSWV